MATYQMNRMDRFSKPLHARLLDEISRDSGQFSAILPGDDKLRFFVAKDGQEFDLSGVNILHNGVDTIKQLYAGVPCSDMVSQIKRFYDSFIGGVIELFGHSWKLGSGGKSGYRYRLQNNELGLIVFFVSTYGSVDSNDNYFDGSHLKIECSPGFLYQYSPDEVQAKLDSIAQHLLIDWRYQGIAVHMCVDVLGWDVPKDFDDWFVTRSKRSCCYSPITQLEFFGSDVAIKYGGAQTLTYGSPSGIQFSIYDKTTAAVKQDKIDFWESVWCQAYDYDQFKPFYQRDNDGFRPMVRRIELRFHHSVVSQFSAYLSELKKQHFQKYQDDIRGKSFCSIRGSNIYPFAGDYVIHNYLTLVQHLAGLWEYGLTSFRLHYNTTTLHPFWTMLFDDITWGYKKPEHLEYQRKYKMAGSAGHKNILLAVGNMLTLYARKGFDTRRAMIHLKRSGIYDDLVNYYENYRRLSRDCIFDFVNRGLQNRWLVGKAA